MEKSLQGNKVIRKTITYVFCALGVFCAVFPLVWTLLTAFKPSTEMFSYPPSLLPKHVTVKNFIDAWNKAPFGRFFLNSFFVTAIVVSGQLFFSSMAAFAFARIKFHGRTFFFFCFLSSMMVPGIVIMIPQFITFRILRLLDTYWALILPGFFGSAFCVFFMRQFFMSMPDSLQEAAEIDGCGYGRMFLRIFLPMVTHALITLGLIRIVGVWNDFLWPLISTNREVLRTVPVAIATVFFSYRNIDWAGLTAASSIALLPLVILFLCTRDYIIESIALTGFK
ncbi:MAG: carbohydrate ABC transporter permease [Treponema sp.]|jgi:multiple sugar transport system permease protein|nr:carbohydrate ABC transporter permease [Treponema sp.]